jgi:hypothetical protein
MILEVLVPLIHLLFEQMGLYHGNLQVARAFSKRIPFGERDMNNR